MSLPMLMVLKYSWRVTLRANPKLSALQSRCSTLKVISSTRARPTIMESTRSKFLEVVPVRGDLRIVLKAGPEHQAEFRIPASDLPVYPKRKAAVLGIPKEPHPQETIVNEDEENRALPHDQALLKRLVEEVVDSRIQSLETMLRQQQKILMELKERRFSSIEIFGGIGWILGIVGVAAYLMSRRHMIKR